MAEITKEQIEAIVSQVVQNVRDQSMLQDKSVDLKTLIPSGSVVFSTVGQAVAWKAETGRDRCGHPTSGA
ncbi:TPA: hypothetical protein EYN98_09920 [Candidatus Poribacteria bacterium]|nr:hypothetical protein [Candidatus Poribacteria bacterium]